MTKHAMTRVFGLILMAFALLMATGCCTTRTQVVLIEGLDGKVGAVEVESDGQKQVLDKPNAGVNLTGDGVRGTFVATDEEIKAAYGDALDALPVPPETFLVYFISGGTTLVADSQRLVPQIVAKIRETERPKISIVGHADSVGNDEYNYRLAYDRAEYVRDLLLAEGVDSAGIVSVDSHGSGNPLVPTPENVPEPRNRRVEVIVR